MGSLFSEISGKFSKSLIFGSFFPIVFFLLLDWIFFRPFVPPLQGAFAASIVAFFSFLGFEAAANMAEEVKNPSKAYPRALFGAIFTAAVVYLLIAIGAVIVVPPAAGPDAGVTQVTVGAAVVV